MEVTKLEACGSAQLLADNEYVKEQVTTDRWLEKMLTVY